MTKWKTKLSINNFPFKNQFKDYALCKNCGLTWSFLDSELCFSCFWTGQKKKYKQPEIKKGFYYQRIISGLKDKHKKDSYSGVKHLGHIKKNKLLLKSIVFATMNNPHLNFHPISDVKDNFYNYLSDFEKKVLSLQTGHGL